METIYLDNNATTRPAPEVVEAMLGALTEGYGNPSSVHRMGQRAAQLLDEARGKTAALINCSEANLLFTGGGTEAINTAIRGILAARTPRRQIVTTFVEHSATDELCQLLARDGVQIVFIEVDQSGALDWQAMEKAISDETALVTVMWANNETGVLFPVARLAELCRARRVPFHCDATQAVGKIPVDMAQIPIDALSFAAHKFHGPKGVGALYIRPGQRIRPLIVGGPQERGRRAGTENVPGVVGLGKAAELAREFLPQMSRVAASRDRLEMGILSRIEDCRVNGGPDRIPNTTNIGFARLEAEAILLLLSEKGICASAGSACSSGSLEPSRVLKAMKIDSRVAHGAVRFSLSRYTTEPEIDRTLQTLPGVIDRLRQTLPVG